MHRGPLLGDPSYTNTPPTAIPEGPFFQIWGALSTTTQVLLLVGAPLVAIGITELCHRRERTLYFTALAALVACACFVLNLAVLGIIFNVHPTQQAFLAWGALAIILAYAYGLRLLQVAGILCLVGYLSTTLGTWRGIYWLSLGKRPENYFLAGALLLVTPGIVQHRRCHDFPPVYRIFGLLCVFIPILVLANWGERSYLLLEPHTVQTLYQLLGFGAAGLAIWIGIRQSRREVTHMGSTFFAIFLYTKFFDWWWDWMPKYLFFAVLGLTAILILLALRRLRAFFGTEA